MSAEHEKQYCDLCKVWGDHSTAQHKTWTLTKRPRKPISRPIVNRDPDSATR